MWESLLQALDNSIFDQVATRWVAALAVLVATVALLGLAKHLLVNRLGRLSKRTAISVLEVVVGMLEKTTVAFYLAAGLHVAALVVELPERLARVVEVVVIVTVFFQIGRWASEGVARVIEHERPGAGQNADADQEADLSRATALSAIRFMARFLIWIAVVLLVLGNLGFDITALVASLGIGGVAVALAVQNILRDLFASLSILVDKPFVIGDFIIVGDFMGTVEKVGMKTTRLRSLGGEQLIFSNTDLLESRVRNYKRMEERRVVFEFGVVYQTSNEQIEQIPPMVREIVEQVELTRFDRAHFKGFGESAFKFEVVYYVLSPDYNVYMDIHQEILLTMLRKLRAQNIAFAYPTRTVHLQGDRDSRPARAPATWSSEKAG